MGRRFPFPLNKKPGSASPLGPKRNPGCCLAYNEENKGKNVRKKWKLGTEVIAYGALLLADHNYMKVM